MTPRHELKAFPAVSQQQIQDGHNSGMGTVGETGKTFPSTLEAQGAGLIVVFDSCPNFLHRVTASALLPLGRQATPPCGPESPIVQYIAIRFRRQASTRLATKRSDHVRFRRFGQPRIDAFPLKFWRECQCVILETRR